MSRIIAGKHRGRRLSIPKGRDIRPTTDRMRERLFSMLTHSRYPDLHGAYVADLFAGTGALGLEALSRGAAHVSFVEKAPTSIATIKDNVASLKAEKEVKILKNSATALPKATQAYDFIFMDPPYRQGLVEPTLLSIISGEWLAENGVIICELAVDDPLNLPTELEIIDERSQGQQRVLFLNFRE
ncbi:MAG: 16S rRNA (guanine(966)-N(2))-methyltransferase RsmD [Kordiimonas sp.]